MFNARGEDAQEQGNYLKVRDAQVKKFPLKEKHSGRITHGIRLKK
jgi:hypothetical protein